MSTRFVPKTEFETDLTGHKANILQFIKDFYKDHGMGPKQEEIRDGLQLENDLVSHVLNIMVEEGTDVEKIQA